MTVSRRDETEWVKRDVGLFVGAEIAAVAIQVVLDRAGLPRAEVALSLVDDAGIAGLNERHRGKPGPTDVLSFPLVEPEQLVSARGALLTANDALAAGREPEEVLGEGTLAESLPPLWRDLPAEQWLLGDVVISVERAREQAGELGHGIDREMAFLAVHGTLHLLGFDHEGEDEEQVMFGATEAILVGLGLGR